MDRLNSVPKFENHEDELDFTDKFKDLLPGMRPTETIEMREARTAAVEALATKDPDLIRDVWIMYADVWQEIVDCQTTTDPQLRAQMQIAAIVHKALIFREARDIERYSEELSEAEEYAHTVQFNTIAEAIGRELDTLSL